MRNAHVPHVILLCFLGLQYFAVSALQICQVGSESFGKRKLSATAMLCASKDQKGVHHDRNPLGLYALVAGNLWTVTLGEYPRQPTAPLVFPIVQRQGINQLAVLNSAKINSFPHVAVYNAAWHECPALAQHSPMWYNAHYGQHILLLMFKNCWIWCLLTCWPYSSNLAKAKRTICFHLKTVFSFYILWYGILRVGVGYLYYLNTFHAKHFWERQLSL